MKFTPEVLLSAPRRSAGVPNPSGTSVLYTTSTYSFETHKKDIELRVLDVATGDSKRLAHNDDISDLNWLDNDMFACLQAEKDGTTSVFWASMSECQKGVEKGRSHYVAGSINASAGNLKVTKLDDEGHAFGIVVSAKANPDGSLYTVEDSKKTTHSTGRLYDSLYVRHWDAWETKEKNALWYGKLSKGKDGKFSLSKLTNALKATRLECPIPPFGGTDNFDISRKSIIFVAKAPDLNPALNTRTNVHVIHIDAWDDDRASLSSPGVHFPGFDGACTNPVVDPNGTRAAFLWMRKNGYEADKNEIFCVWPLDREAPPTPVALVTNTEGRSWDRSPSSICFSADSEWFLVTAEDCGTAKLYAISTDPAAPVNFKTLTSSGYVNDVRPLADGRVFVSGTTLVDNSFYAVVDPSLSPDKTEDLISWTSSNSGQGSKFGLTAAQVSCIWTPASNPDVTKEIHSIIVRPSNFDSNKKYPVAYIIHGGPQGSWADNWSTRWNLAVFAEQGYIVIAPNPTGSTGYGQKFTDAINRNWGGDPYYDIVKCFEWVGENMSEADNSRAVALGASYGGYMMNWIQGHNLGRKFKALVCHDGILTHAGLLATEELYFPFHDLGGTPWFDPGFKAKDGHSAASQSHRNFGPSTFSDWRKYDPSEHFDKWATPELVIHSTKDYRLPIADGLGAFNVLQARGVDSQFLTFPDENHWVLKPENSLVWHKVVLNWINKYVGLPPYTDEDPSGEKFWGGSRAGKEEVVEMMTQGKPET